MQAIAAVTFDFHNTLVRADGWLELEIRTLPRVVLVRLAALGVLAPVGATMEARATSVYEAIREEAKASGREVSARGGVLRVLERLGLAGRVSAADLDSAIAEAERGCLDGAAVVPGAGAALEALVAAGMRLAVVSSAAYPPFVTWGLARYDLARYFAVVATSAVAGYYKTDPRLYAWALARLGVPPAHAVHVGDHPRFDVQGAQAAGMRAILFAPDDPPAATAPAECRPDATIRAMAELPAALARLGAPT